MSIMGNRLSKIYTRTGDQGTTGLGDGERVDKDSLRVAAYGTVDELNRAIGLVLSANLPAAINAWSFNSDSAQAVNGMMSRQARKRIEVKNLFQSFISNSRFA